MSRENEAQTKALIILIVIIVILFILFIIAQFLLIFILLAAILVGSLFTVTSLVQIPNSLKRRVMLYVSLVIITSLVGIFLVIPFFIKGNLYFDLFYDPYFLNNEFFWNKASILFYADFVIALLYRGIYLLIEYHNDKKIDITFSFKSSIPFLSKEIITISRKDVFCPNCGIKIKKTWNICPYCGGGLGGTQDNHTRIYDGKRQINDDTRIYDGKRQINDDDKLS